MAYKTLTTWPGAWTCSMHIPTAAPLAAVRQALDDLADATGWPVNAFAYGTADTVDELLIYRDPSQRHGIPSVIESEGAAHTLAAASGWTLATNQAPARGILVGFELREGYEPDAPLHDIGELLNVLPAAELTSCRQAWLISARGTRRRQELCAVLRGSSELLPAITIAAGKFQQERFVVTDLAQQRVYAMQREMSDGD
ncbi:hypothetical protein [Actinosynnema sp. ALI-1.44]|uniref:hypothetical protein n=1 Tax=Actinosynnema sp. ALI-1.44 TaxID=1933779 RepID=UPI00117770EC|nr:hypothetical protein [Actinosynnema sp. ALI-1.44]